MIDITIEFLKQVLSFVLSLCPLILAMAMTVFNHVDFDEVDSRYNTIVNWIRWIGGIMTLIILLITIGGFARGEVSPFFWVEFKSRFVSHGFFEALWSAIAVITTNIYVFLLPSIVYMNRFPPEKRITKVWAILLNIFLGLFLIQQENAIYKLIEMLPSRYGE